jgi:Rieske Fe-S protein
MLGGLVAGYGKLVLDGLTYLQPDEVREDWVFVAPVSQFALGDSLPFTSPTGIRVVITRQAVANAEEAVADDFIALSSVCPHLGCRVHWEAHNKRFFCPCHNGEFDPAGRPTGGPPLAANQSLPKYPLQVNQGLLFIKMPLITVGAVAGNSSTSPGGLT